ncbi:3-oxoacyl-ACP reductase FabG [Sorangium sp. So ce296]|uniref:SDR family NAD(P)-dependent oxidoreductase n=1 Tax=Sorangium sp. So ce296 TaxID=3133296 RepID=UPI003F607E98
MTPTRIETKDKTNNPSRVAMVTGAGGAMGAAIARSLLAEGHRVVLADADRAALDAVTASLGDGAYPILFDLSDSAQVEAACADVRERVGAVEILVNNAGVLSNHKLAETTPEEWRKIMAVNLDGPYHLSREWVPSMRERGWGRIINMCSVAMKTGGLTAGTAYTASKGALGGLTFSLARELAPHGVTVNAIAPAYVRTKMITEQLTEEQRQRTLKQIPVGRFCEPEEIAHAVVFLSSPLAGFITGELLDINGGLHLD